MKVFEFHFNSQQKGQNVFDSFIFDPEDNSQEPLGSIIIAGQIDNALPQSYDLLKNLAEIIKEEHYKSSNVSPKIAFKKSLVKANSFLKNLVKEGNVNWLGNFNFAAININQDLISFVKVGNIKILLIRDNETYDISDNLEYQGSDGIGSYFLNVALGKLSPDDRLIIANSELYDSISDNELLKDIINENDWSQKKLSELFKNSKDDLKETKGMALLITMQLKDAKRPNFSFSFPKITIPKIKKPNMDLPNFNFTSKKIAIFAFFTLIIAGGIFLAFKFGLNKEKTQTATVSQEQTTQNQGSQTQVAQTDAPVLPEPKIPAFFNMGDLNYSPTKIAAANSAIYLFNNTTEFYRINTKDLKSVKDTSEQNLEMLALGENSIFFFSPTSTISEYDMSKDVLGYQQIKLSENIKISDLIYYNNKLYFLDSENGIIYKKSKDKIEESLKDQRIVGAKSIAIDGNIWILTQGNKIDKYFSGKFIESIMISGAVNAKKIWTQRGNDNIYVLDPEGTQILVIDKKGNIVKTHQDPAWINIKDFAVNEKGLIYLIDNQKIYELQ